MPCYRCWPISGATVNYSNKWRMKDGNTMPAKTPSLLAPRWISKPPPCLEHPTNEAEEIRTFADWKATTISGETVVAEQEITGMANRREGPTSLQSQIGNAAGERAWIRSPLHTHQMITIPGGVGHVMTSPWRWCRVRRDRPPRIQSETRMTTPMTGRSGWRTVGVGVGRTKTCGCKTVGGGYGVTIFELFPLSLLKMSLNSCTGRRFVWKFSLSLMEF